MTVDFNKEYDYLFKLVLVGDSGVGKSSLVLRYCDNTFTEALGSTIGVDFRMHYILLDNKGIKLQIWDTAGQDRFRTITTSYYRHAHGVILVYDVADRTTFDNIRNVWLQEIDRFAPPNVPIFLVGNKADMHARRVVSHDEGQALADRLKAGFLETSARDSSYVEQAFLELSRTIKSRVDVHGQDVLKTRDPSAIRRFKGESVEQIKESPCCTIL